MATLGDLKADVADDVDDATGEYGAQINAAIRAAIRYCERKKFYFNETREKTFNTVVSQVWYDAAALADIPTLVHIQRVYITTNGIITDLRSMSNDEMEVLSDNSAAVGEPYAYCYFGQRIRIYPIPKAVYQIRLQLGPYRLGALEKDGDENAWTIEAYDMIKARAKYVVYKNTLKDAALAAEALNDYQDQFWALKGETSNRNGSGILVSTQF